MGVLPRCDLINTGYNKLLTNIRRFLSLSTRSRRLSVEVCLLDRMSGRDVTSAVGLRVVAGITLNMAFTNPGMSSVVSRWEALLVVPFGASLTTDRWSSHCRIRPGASVQLSHSAISIWHVSSHRFM